MQDCDLTVGVLLVGGVQRRSDDGSDGGQPGLGCRQLAASAEERLETPRRLLVLRGSRVLRLTCCFLAAAWLGAEHPQPAHTRFL